MHYQLPKLTYKKLNRKIKWITKVNKLVSKSREKNGFSEVEQPPSPTFRLKIISNRKTKKVDKDLQNQFGVVVASVWKVSQV